MLIKSKNTFVINQKPKAHKIKKAFFVGALSLTMFLTAGQSIQAKKNPFIYGALPLNDTLTSVCPQLSCLKDTLIIRQDEIYVSSNGKDTTMKLDSEFRSNTGLTALPEKTQIYCASLESGKKIFYLPPSGSESLIMVYEKDSGQFEIAYMKSNTNSKINSESSFITIPNVGGILINDKGIIYSDAEKIFALDLTDVYSKYGAISPAIFNYHYSQEVGLVLSLFPFSWSGKWLEVAPQLSTVRCRIVEKTN